MQAQSVWAPSFSLAATKEIPDASRHPQLLEYSEMHHDLVSFPPGTEMFHFPGLTSHIREMTANAAGFPHSEIFGSQVARHLTEAYRSFTTSFIVVKCLGIHHTPLALPSGMLKTAICSFW